jgi:hypothetical protein
MRIANINDSGYINLIRISQHYSWFGGMGGDEGEENQLPSVPSNQLKYPSGLKGIREEISSFSSQSSPIPKGI